MIDEKAREKYKSHVGSMIRDKFLAEELRMVL